MNDNLRVYRAIHQALFQLCPTPPKGHFARHLTTLAMFISGIVRSQKTQLPALAQKIPTATHPESRIKQLVRWLKNGRITPQDYYLPFAQAVLWGLPADRPLVFVIDSSNVGKGCCVWMLSVVYQKRALPLVWHVSTGTKGHASDEDHLKLLRQVRAWMIEIGLPERRVIFLGDGEFDGVPVQKQVREWGWDYVLRTAKNRIFYLETSEHKFHYDDLPVEIGQTISFLGTITGERYGPVRVIGTWPPTEDDPIYLVSSLASGEEACEWYRQRFRIETFFSDQKSRGFHLHQSHLSDPERLSRLLIGAGLAYLWVVFLGVKAEEEGWRGRIHRKNRCDWSLFRLGLALLDHFLNLGRELSVYFFPPPTLFDLFTPLRPSLSSL